jgi:hypothetical protein
MSFLPFFAKIYLRNDTFILNFSKTDINFRIPFFNFSKFLDFFIESYLILFQVLM